MQSTKAYVGWAKVQLHSFLVPALDASGRPYAPSRFTPEKTAAPTHWVGGRIAPEPIWTSIREKEKTGAQNIVKEIKQYQKKWLQHVQRMNTNWLPKQALKYKPKGRRNVGPRKRWRDQLHLEDQGTGNTPKPSWTWWRWWWWWKSRLWWEPTPPPHTHTDTHKHKKSLNHCS